MSEGAQERLGNPARPGRPRDVTAKAQMRVLQGGRAEPGDDRGTLLAAAAGDEGAVRALYRQHVDRIHRHVARILGPSDPDVEDVVQQVFLAALDGAGRFDGRSSVSTWLYGIATRRALDEARSRARRRRWSQITEKVGLGRPAARPDVRHGAVAEAEAALEALRPDQRQVFVLHDVEGYTFAEIREMTGTGISTLHARLKAARKKLDAIVATAGEDDGDEDDGSAA